MNKAPKKKNKKNNDVNKKKMSNMSSLKKRCRLSQTPAIQSQVMRP